MSSNAFHPALVGLLYGALAQHEQALIQMALAANIAQADVDDEIAERYGAIVDGLKRMIKAAEPSGYDDSTLGVTEDIRHKHALLGSILSHLTDFKVGSCSISPHYGQGIQINMPFAHTSPEVDVRAALREIAQRLDLQYGERRHGSSGTTLHAAATGKIQDVDVEIYELVTAERPICDTHGVMVAIDDRCDLCEGGEAGGCPGCEGWHRPPWCADLSNPVEAKLTHALMPDGAETTRCGADLGSPIVVFLDNVTCPECRRRVEAQLAEENGTDDPDDLTDTEPPGDAPSTDAGLLQASVLPVADIETPSPKRKARLRHAPMPERSELPLCGRSFGNLVAASHADVSCPTCLELTAREQSGDDETESTTTEPPGDAL